MRPPEETPSATISPVSQLSCALVDPVGPILPVCRFPVLGRDLGPAVSLVCIAPHDEPSGQPLWYVCGTVFDRQGSTILQQTVATGFSNHALTSCDCAKLHELAKFWRPHGNSGIGTPNPGIQRQQHIYPSVHCSNIAQCLLPFLHKLGKLSTGGVAMFPASPAWSRAVGRDPTTPVVSMEICHAAEVQTEQAVLFWKCVQPAEASLP